MAEIQVIYQDCDLLAVCKPAGLLVHPSPIARDVDEDLVSLLQAQTGRAVFPCHRLDRPTSGVMLFAFNVEAARLITAAFAARVVKKRYTALVRGWIPQGGVLDYALKLEDPRARGGSRPLQSAVTEYAPVDWYEHPEPSGPYATTRLTLCELHPKTGRRHQLRRHLSHLRHPIIGDTTHGDGKLNRWSRAALGTSRLFLHAARLELKHPRTEECLALHCPVDDDWASALRLLTPVQNP